VGITPGGEIRYEGKAVNLAQLQREMSRVHTTSPEAMVLIQADRESRHGRVVEVMDLAKQVGFERIGIAIEAKAASRPREEP
jgi:biopolymer transport protein ExbD